MTDTNKNLVQYQIIPKSPEAHVFAVRCVIPQPNKAGQRVWLPVWTPGSYMIRDFARHITTLQAESGGKIVAYSKLNKYTWLFQPCEGELILTYEVYAADLSVRGAYLDNVYGFFNGSSVFLAVQGQENQACLLTVEVPADKKPWKIATAMPVQGAQLQTECKKYYQAGSYEELIDHPVLLGNYTSLSFTACNVPHEVAFVGIQQANLAQLAVDLHTLCETQIRFFGEPAPMSYYLFIVLVVGEGYGGLEHRASSALICSREDLPKLGEAKMSERYRVFLGLCSHEYFHTWNVKRIKPSVYAPYDLTQEVYTELLWAFEGITSYYDDLLLVRSGLMSENTYLELLGQNITRLLRTPGRYKQSLAESSFDAWIKFYKQDENSPNAMVSYYVKGALFALVLDLSIRQLTQDAASLDDVMQLLWRDYAQKGQGIEQKDIEAVVATVVGQDLSELWQLGLYSTADLPLIELLATRNLRVTLRPAESSADKGGRASAIPSDILTKRSTLGLSLKSGISQAEIAYVTLGGAAQSAGLSAGDIIVALNSIKVTAANFEALVVNYPIGTNLCIYVFRRDELMSFNTVTQAMPFDTCVLSKNEIQQGRHTTLNWLCK